MRDPVPPPFPSYEPGTFAEFTVQKRLPKILSEVRGQLAERHRADPRWDELSGAVTRGGPIDGSLFAADTPYWAARIAALTGRSWLDLPFFDLEFFFYKAIDTIVLDLEPGLDVFAATRHESLIDSLPQVARRVESTPLDLETALEQAVSGNEADLSQIAASGEVPKSSLLVDERSHVVERLRRLPSAAVVHFLADNAGSELCFDLVLVERLLKLEVRAVELHVKPSPMFVSDALGVDVEETVSAFERCSPGVPLARVGRALRRAMRDDRLRIRAPRDWAEPRHVDALEPELSHSLRTAHLVLVKGDLNYRRYFGDRAWPAHTPVETASLTDEQHAFALRVLKSDCVVGIPAADAERLASSEPEWRVNRRHSIVQRVDRGPRKRGAAPAPGR